MRVSRHLHRVQLPRHRLGQRGTLNRHTLGEHAGQHGQQGSGEQHRSREGLPRQQRWCSSSAVLCCAVRVTLWVGGF